MDFEQALRLLQALHRHIEALEELAGRGNPARWSTSVTEAREQATRVVDQMLSADKLWVSSRPEGLDMGQVPNLFGQPKLMEEP